MCQERPMKNKTQSKPEVDQEAAPDTDPRAKTEPTIKVRAVYGMMNHPFFLVDIPQGAFIEVPSIDPWLQSQIDAGKIISA